MTLETQKPGAGAGDPAVFTSLIHREHETLRQAKKRGDRPALLTAWLARQDLLELIKRQRASALPTQLGKEVTHEETSNVRRSSAEEGEEEDLTARSVRQNTSLLSKPAGGSLPAGDSEAA